jgi:hypothetical protein
VDKRSGYGLLDYLLVSYIEARDGEEHIKMQAVIHQMVMAIAPHTR